MKAAIRTHKNKTFTVNTYGAEFSVKHIGSGQFTVTEYRTVKSFRGYRTAQIKPVVLSKIELKAWVASFEV